MNCFNKTEAAVFSCRLCFLRAFPVITLLLMKVNVYEGNSRNNNLLVAIYGPWCWLVAIRFSLLLEHVGRFHVPRSRSNGCSAKGLDRHV